MVLMNQFDDRSGIGCLTGKGLNRLWQWLSQHCPELILMVLLPYGKKDLHNLMSIKKTKILELRIAETTKEVALEGSTVH